MEKFIIHNTVEDIDIFRSDDLQNFIDFVRSIRDENEDFDHSILNRCDAAEYIDIFCGNLEMVYH